MSISELLKKLAPRTPAAKRERFVPYLEEAVERYSINTELRLAAFLATCCFESDYFRTTVEYRAKSGRAKTLQDRYWGTGYYGRGLIQLTHEGNYEAFREFLYTRFLRAEGAYVDVHRNPDKVAEPLWAVESACWFWQKNNLNKYADQGNFFAIQGLVNRGSATKRALDYETRLSLYDIALRAIPDNPSAAALGRPVKEESEARLQPSKPSASDPSVQQQTIFERTTNWIGAKKEALSKIGIEPDISGTSKAVIGSVKGTGWSSLIYGFVTGNWPYIVLGVVMVALGVWYFSRSKDRAQQRKLVR